MKKNIMKWAMLITAGWMLLGGNGVAAAEEVTVVVKNNLAKYVEEESLESVKEEMTEEEMTEEDVTEEELFEIEEAEEVLTEGYTGEITEGITGEINGEINESINGSINREINGDTIGEWKEAYGEEIVAQETGEESLQGLETEVFSPMEWYAAENPVEPAEETEGETVVTVVLPMSAADTIQAQEGEEEDDFITIEDYATPLGIGYTEEEMQEAAQAQIQEAAAQTQMPEMQEAAQTQTAETQEAAQAQTAETQEADEQQMDPLQAEQPDAERKVTIFTSLQDDTHPGETVCLTSQVEGFTVCSGIAYQWMCDKGLGFEPVAGANEDNYSFTADEENIEWSWRLMVYYC